MSRMAEHALEQDSRDLEEAALRQHEQEMLRRDPAFLAWLNKLNAETQKELNMSNDLNSMSFGELVPSKSKYLSKDDVGEDGVDLTIRGFKREVVEGDNGDEDKTVLYFVEPGYKPMILNKTNSNRLGIATGVATAGEARGKVVNVFNDPFVEFGGKVTGGLRIRKAQGMSAPPPAPKMDDMDAEW